jgi:hypothetical protein
MKRLTFPLAVLTNRLPTAAHLPLSIALIEDGRLLIPHRRLDFRKCADAMGRAAMKSHRSAFANREMAPSAPMSTLQWSRRHLGGERLPDVLMSGVNKHISHRRVLPMSTANTISRLRQRMVEDMTARNLGHHMQRSHIYSCKRAAAFLKRSPGTATADDVRGFQLHLVDASIVSAIATGHAAKVGER